VEDATPGLPAGELPPVRARPYGSRRDRPGAATARCRFVTYQPEEAHVFEFKIEGSADVLKFGPRDPAEVVDRLKELHELAAKLHAAGWPVWSTTTGLGFRVPDGCADEDEVQRRLAALGIEELFDVGCSRTWDDLLRAKAGYEDALWYERVVEFLRSPAYDPQAEFRRRPQAVRDMLARKHAIEQRSPCEEAALPPLARAIFTAKLMALRWLCGEPEAPEPWSPSPLWDLPDAAGEQDLDNAAPTAGEGR
jgi:hypothetical protein